MQLALTALKQSACHKLEKTSTSERWIAPELQMQLQLTVACS
jgi:hypothetical protein